MKQILLTGGAGYIGSHTAVELINEGYEIIIVDNLINSSKESIKRIENITGKKVAFHCFDLINEAKLEKLFKNSSIDSVIHFAGLKAVGESVENPVTYYDNNISSTLSLIKVMNKHNVKKMVFSSSATVYGDPNKVPITEKSPIGTGLTNPYGRTKYFIEQILNDLTKTKKNWQITSLRYFNPIGAHASGLIGENPNGRPNNLMPFITQVASGKREILSIYGNDYSTKDGTGIRDYIHVVDLSKAHLAALKKPAKKNIYRYLNIGTGNGTSVLDLIKAFEKTNKIKINYRYDSRRDGDIAECYADPTLAENELIWKAINSIEDACRDSWNWQCKNPNGYE